MTRPSLFAAMGAATGALVAGPALAASISVTNALDAGEGSFRDAVEAANLDASVDTIVFEEGLDPIELESMVIYSGTQTLEIRGAGNRIRAAASHPGNLLEVDSGASLDVSNLIFAGGEAQSIFMDVPAATTGTVRLSLTDVVIRDFGLHGAHVSDGASSPASMRLDLQRVNILSNGLLGFSDFDGIRVDEKGDGDLIANIKNTVALFNGGDGIELDETDAGTAKADVRDSSFDQNGPQDPADLEDGFDIDETGDGDLICTIVNVSASGNFDGGIDLDEEDGGRLIAKATGLSATGNGADGMKTTEEGDGDSEVKLARSRVVGTYDNDGVEFEQEAPGTMKVTVSNTLIASNLDTGLQIDTDAPGVLKLSKTTIIDNDPDLDVPGDWIVKK